ncbi:MULTISPECIES: adhesive domain-containing protein [unclassified Bacillus cereus group]|uniref:adhesive domain-containing protein n=1 Tax=unclassified Bacillus cereus group TaxID=2750818 RepID=UPI001F5A2749|nr:MULTISPECIES: adhesive domain-containing protein [unclassified Bacillus cereus group]
MKKQIKKLGILFLIGGVLVTQTSVFGYVPNKVYAATNDQQGIFSVDIDKKNVKVNENVVLKVTNKNKEDQYIEIPLSDEQVFNEEETNKLNEKNKAIQVIYLPDQRMIQISKKEKNEDIGDVSLVIQIKKAGEYTFVSTAKSEGQDKKVESTVLKVEEQEKHLPNVKKEHILTQQKNESPEDTKSTKETRNKGDQKEVGTRQQIESEEKKPENVEGKSEPMKVRKEVKQKKSNRQLGAMRYKAPMQGQVPQLDCFKNVKTEELPGDSAFIMRKTSETKLIASSGYVTKFESLKVDNNHPTGSVTFKNIGYYNGKKVTLRVDLTAKSPSGGELFFNNDYFLGIDAGPQFQGSKGSVDVEYSFFDETGEPLSLKTVLNYQGLNKNKYISVYDFEQKIENVFALSNTLISYNNLGGGTYRFGDDATPSYYDDRIKISFQTKKVHSLKIHVDNRDTTTSSVRYETKYFFKVAIPKVDALNQTFQVANDPKISAGFIQTIPYLAQQGHMKQLSYLVTSDTGNQYTKSKWIVENIQGTDRTDWFTFEENPDGTTKITAKPETVNNQNFYDTVYIFKQIYDFVGSETNPVNKSRLKDNNMYPIHFTVSQSVDGTADYGKTNGTTLINYMSQVQVQHIDQDTKQPIPNVQDTVVEGMITDPFHVNPLEIPGYQVVKNQPITGIFLPEKQVLSHIYTPVKATLEATDFSTVVGNIPTDKEEMKKCILKEAKVKAMELPSNTDITSQVEVVDIGGLHNQIGSYTVTLKVKNVEKTITVNVIEGSLAFISVPEKISFENIRIPSREKIVNRSRMQGEIVVSDKRENGKEWSVYVKQVKPLTSSEKVVLPDAFVYTKNGVDTVLNDQNYLVHSQKSTDYHNVSINWKDSEGIRLKVKPGPNVKVNETYQGELEWTLTDAPM